MIARLVPALAILSAAFLPATPHTQDLQPPSPTALVWSPSTGRQAEVQVREQLLFVQDGQSLTVYEAEIPSSLLASLVESRQAWDSTWAVKVTIWMYFNTFNYGGATWVSVSKYETRWDLYDISVAMRNASMNAGCMGDSWDGPPEECEPEAYAQRWIGNPTSGTVYRQTPPWAGHYIALGYQAGNSKVQLRRGTTAWWLEICIFKGSCGID